MHARLSSTAPISELLDVVSASDRPDDLIAVGTAIHCFTEPLHSLLHIDLIDLHRSTTILTKQIARLLGAEDPLTLIASLVTDPARAATTDGRSAADVCGDAWPAVCEIASGRAQAAIDGASTFGESTVLRLAATRAAGARAPWWGTAAWHECVDAAPIGHRVALHLLNEPEFASDADLGAALGHRSSTRPDTLACHGRALA